MGMNAPEPFEPPRTQPDPVQVRNQDMFIITDNDIGHLALPRHHQGDLSLHIQRHRGYLPDQFMGDDFMPGDSPAIYFLKAVYLAGLETTCFTVNFFYGSGLKLRCSDSFFRVVIHFAAYPGQAEEKVPKIRSD